MDSNDAWKPRKLTHEQARAEQRLSWSRMTVQQRLAGAAELTRSMFQMRGIDLDDFETDFTPRRISRRQR